MLRNSPSPNCHDLLQFLISYLFLFLCPHFPIHLCHLYQRNMLSQTARRSLTYPRPSFLCAYNRSLHQSARSLLPRKDAQGKDDLTPESNEYSKSGSDAQSAQMDQAAFDPKKTSPEEEHDVAGQEAGPVRTKTSVRFSSHIVLITINFVLVDSSKTVNTS